MTRTQARSVDSRAALPAAIGGRVTCVLDLMKLARRFGEDGGPGRLHSHHALRNASVAVLLVVSACSANDGGDSTESAATESAAGATVEPLPAATSPAYDALLGDSAVGNAGDRARSDGRVQVLVHAKSDFDEWSRPLDPKAWETMSGLYDSMVVYSPYFDQRLELFDDVFVYRDLYGLKVDSDRDRRAYEHPEWVLRTAQDDPVYIPFACDEPSGCPQFAADVGNPAFRDAFIDDVRRLVEIGYPGLLIDDVNMAWRLSDRTGESTVPIDPRTGDDLLLEDWNLYVTEFVEAVRNEFPDLSIMHNSLWFADSPAFDDPLVERQIAAADVIMIERGATDAGLAPGDGQFGFESLLDYTDRVHRLDANVLLLDETATTRREQAFGLVTGLMVNNGGDMVTTEDYSYLAPESFWRDFELDLGAANGARVAVEGNTGVWRRDFERGIVLLNEPGRDVSVVDLGGRYVDSTGSIVERIELEAGEATVLARTS